MVVIQTDLDRLIEEGEVPYVHCWGGVGRTGTVVGCFLVDQGVASEEAIDRIAELRIRLERSVRTSPETPDQLDLIREWAQRVRSN